MVCTSQIIPPATASTRGANISAGSSEITMISKALGNHGACPRRARNQFFAGRLLFHNYHAFRADLGRLREIRARPARCASAGAHIFCGVAAEYRFGLDFCKTVFG